MIRKKFIIPVIITIFILVSQAVMGVTIKYVYDEAGRLVSADYGYGKYISFTYDNNGNLLKRQISEYTLADAIAALKVCAGFKSPDPVYLAGDIDNNGLIGLEEALYILQKISGKR